MKRLTNEDGICINCDGIAHCRADCSNKKIYDKLKEYEDLGFTPEDIAHLAKFFKERTSAREIAAEMRIVAKLIEAERKEAYWIEQEYAEEYEGLLISNYKCSRCHCWKRKHSNYCPECGSKMAKVI